MSSFNPLSLTLAYHTLHTHGLSLSQSLCSNDLPPIPRYFALGTLLPHADRKLGKSPILWTVKG